MAKAKSKTKATPASDFVPRERVISVHPGQLRLGRYQARFEPVPDQELIDDIFRANGNRSPVLVRDSKLGLEVVGGENRVRAIIQINEDRKIKEHMEVKCVVLDETDKEAALTALRDNILRKDLTTKERDRYIYRLVSEWKYTNKEISDNLGLSEETVRHIVSAFDKTHENIRELLDEGHISVEHAKAVTSLEEEDQKKIATWLRKRAKRKANDDTPMPSKNDVRDKATDYRLRRQVREKMLEHFKKMKKKTIEIEADRKWSEISKICDEVLGGRYYQGYNVQDHDVLTPMKEAGVELSIKEPEGESEVKPTEPKKVNLCSRCELRHGSHCPLDGYNPPRTECDQFLIETGYKWIYGKCLYCGGLTSHMHYLYELGVYTTQVTDPETNLRHECHIFCVIQDILKTKRLKGPCSSCQEDCGVPGVVRARSSLVLTVEKCNDQDELPFKLSEVNRKAVAYHRRLVNEARKNAKAAARSAGRSK